MNQERKARIAAALKPLMPAGWKYSLAVQNHTTLVLTIQAAPVDLLAEVNRMAQRGSRGWHADTYCRVNEYCLEAYFEGSLLETFQKISDAMNDGNHDRSDIQTDYFDVGWYTEISLGRWGRPFVCTAAQPALA